MALAETVRAHATRFRAAIESLDWDENNLFVGHFPHGCCDFACWTLGRYLLEETECGFFGITGGRWEDRSHVWLYQGALIVDITADQFDPALPKVIVDAASNWHRRFEASAMVIQATKPAYYADRFDASDYFNADLIPLYERIRTQVRQSDSSSL